MIKRGFTIIEVLVATAVMSIILMAGISVMKIMTATLYDSQTEIRGLTNLSDNIYYMTREIQSADDMQVSFDRKTLKIKQRGSSDYSKEYSIVDGTPTGCLYFKSKPMLYLNYEQSSFDIAGSNVKITLAMYKTNLDYHVKPKIISLEVFPRSNEVILEVVE